MLTTESYLHVSRATEAQRREATCSSEQSGCLRRVRRGLLKGRRLWDCVKSRPRTKLLEPPRLTPVTRALPFPAWPGYLPPPRPPPPNPGTARGIRRAALDPLRASLRTTWPMGRGERLCESAVERMGTNQLPRARGEGRLYRSALRSRPEQPPRNQPHLQRKGKSDPELEKVQCGHLLSHRWY